MTETARCRWCGLLQPWVGEDLCNVCRHHQGAEIDHTAKRHQEHEEMLRERLAAVTAWGAKADSERNAFGRRMHRALESRDRTVQVLRQISDLHELRADGGCSCRISENCPIAVLLDDRGIQQLIRRVDRYETDQQAKEQLWREMRAAADPDEWDELIRGSGAFREPPRRHEADSA
jgi:hypothetical protein